MTFSRRKAGTCAAEQRLLLSVRIRSAFCALSTAAILFLVFTSSGQSQATWGALSGFVTDGTGAAVPHAKVTATNEKTGVQTGGTADGAGFYNITHLDAGEYTITVEAGGFKQFVEQHVVLRIDSTVRVDASLVLGAVTEQVTVTAEVATLKTEKTDVDKVIAEHDLETIPVPNHNYTRLYLTMPGVTPFSFQIGNHENPSEGYMTSVNGQLWMANDYQVDGISDVAWGFTGLQIIVPPEDSVQELKITTADFDPEYGSAGGMVAQYVTKSGTNALHGSAYWFNQNSATFAANPFTEKVPGSGPQGKGTGPAPFNENVGGLTLGGPIKKNKVFLFGDFRIDRRLLGANILTTVPNDAFRNGDFSAVAATRPIFDPATGNPDGTGRVPFAGNIIPANRLNPVAVNLLSLLPHANLNQNPDRNFLGRGKSRFGTDQFDERFDWNISERDRFFVRYSFMRSLLVNPSIFGGVAGGPAIAGGNPATVRTRNQLLSANYTHTFTPSLLAEFRGGFARFVLNSYQNDSSLSTNNQVGIPNINDGTKLAGGLAGIGVGGPVGGFSMGIFGSVPRLDRSTMYQFVNNWTKLSGNHQVRWGMDIRRNLEDLFTLNQSTRGEFQFNQRITGSPSVSGSGLGVASFLLGQPSFFQRGVFVLFPGERATRASAYGGDTWRVTPRLTVNYGLRWDYIEPVVPAKPGGDVNFDFNTGDLILAGMGDVTKYSNVRPRYNNFAPRIGFAYKLVDKTVIRAGLGRSYFLNGFDAAFNHLDSSYPLAQAQVINQTSNFSPIFPIDQGPPAPTPPIFPSSGHLKPPPNTFIKAFPFERRIPSLDSWNLTIERQLAKDLTISIAYVGNKGTNLDYSFFNVNAAPPGPGSLLNRRPYYQKFGIAGGIFVNCTCDDSNYHALQIITEKRFTSGYSFNSSFTWAKALDHEIGDRGGQSVNPYDRKAMYGVSYLNRAVVWTLTHSYQVPYGKGQRYGANAGVLGQVFLGGWKFDGFTTVESGLALSPTDSNSSTLNADFGQRPNQVPGVPFYPTVQDRNHWLNSSAFQNPPVCCVWGNASPGILRGPSLVSADWAFGKVFTFPTPLNRESTTLEFRWENFNVFNKTNLGQPVTDINSPQYGQIFGVQSAMRRMQFVLHLRW